MIVMFILQTQFLGPFPPPPETVLCLSCVCFPYRCGCDDCFVAAEFRSCFSEVREQHRHHYMGYLLMAALSLLGSRAIAISLAYVVNRIRRRDIWAHSCTCLTYLSGSGEVGLSTLRYCRAHAPAKVACRYSNVILLFDCPFRASNRAQGLCDQYIVVCIASRPSLRVTVFSFSDSQCCSALQRSSMLQCGL